MSKARQNLRKRANQLHFMAEAAPPMSESWSVLTMQWRRIRERLKCDAWAPGGTVKS